MKFLEHPSGASILDFYLSDFSNPFQNEFRVSPATTSIASMISNGLNFIHTTYDYNIVRVEVNYITCTLDQRLNTLSED